MPTIGNLRSKRRQGPEGVRPAGNGVDRALLTRSRRPLICGASGTYSAPGRPNTAHSVGELLSGGIYDCEMIETCTAMPGGAARQALTRVQRNMMMVATCREKRGASAPILLHLKSQRAAIKLHRTLQI